MKQHEQPYFHLKALKYLTSYITEDELQTIKADNKQLHFEVEDGIYTINYNDLIEKALKEQDELNNKFELVTTIQNLITEEDEESESIE